MNFKRNKTLKWQATVSGNDLSDVTIQLEDDVVVIILLSSLWLLLLLIWRLLTNDGL